LESKKNRINKYYISETIIHIVRFSREHLRLSSGLTVFEVTPSFRALLITTLLRQPTLTHASPKLQDNDA
jgi:hypothetical protein